MNWYKKALNVSTLPSVTYFTTCTLPEFYQWQYSGVIPSKTRFSKQVPRSDSSIGDSVLVSAQIDPKSLKVIYKSKSINDLCELKSDSQATPHVVQGNAKTPNELFSKYHNQLKEIQYKINKFAKETSLGSFFVSNSKKATLHKTSTLDNNGVMVLSYGPLKDLFKHFETVRHKLLIESEHKKGKSKDWTTWTRFDNIMTTYNNGTVPLDLAKIEYLIQVANVKPTNSHKSSWADFYFTLFPETEAEYQKINAFMNLGWVKEYLHKV